MTALLFLLFGLLGATIDLISARYLGLLLVAAMGLFWV